MMSRSYLLRKEKVLILFYASVDATVKLFWDVYHQQRETSGQNWVKIGIFDRYTHSLTYLLIPKANMATPTIGGRGHKKRKFFLGFQLFASLVTETSP